MILSRLVLLVLVAGTCAQTAPGQDTARPTPEVSVVTLKPARAIAIARLAELSGVTVCVNGRPVSFVQLGLDSRELADVQAHEAVHRAQYARHGEGCAPFDSVYATPKGMLEAEAEAYSAGLCASVALGADEARLRAAYVQTVYRLLGGGTMVYDIAMAFARYGPCPQSAP